MTPRPNANRRGGFSTIAVLALFALAGALFLVWTRDALQQQRQVRLNHEHAQAEQLAAAALSRAAAQLAADAEYDGEVWRLTADDLAQAYDAEAAISVAADDDQPTTITAVVTLPQGDTPRVSVTRSTVLHDTPPTSDPAPSPGDSP